MKALILAGGKAERMGGYPKPLTFIDGYTIFERQIVWLKQGGFEIKDILVASGNRKDIYDYTKRFVSEENIFKDGEAPIGDAGAIKKAIDKYGKNNRYLVLNGDLLLLFKLDIFLEYCKSISNEYVGAVVVKKMKSRYGVFELSGDGANILSFKEKPEIGIGSCGVYFLRSAIYELLPYKGGFAANVLNKYYKKFCLYVIKENEWVPIETKKDINIANKLSQNRKG